MNRSSKKRQIPKYERFLAVGWEGKRGQLLPLIVRRTIGEDALGK